MHLNTRSHTRRLLMWQTSNNRNSSDCRICRTVELCFAHSKRLAQMSAIRQMSRGRVKNLCKNSRSVMWKPIKTRACHQQHFTELHPHNVDMRPISTFHQSTSGRGVSGSCRGWGLTYTSAITVDEGFLVTTLLRCLSAKRAAIAQHARALGLCEKI